MPRGRHAVKYTHLICKQLVVLPQQDWDFTTALHIYACSSSQIKFPQSFRLYDFHKSESHYRTSKKTAPPVSIYAHRRS